MAAKRAYPEADPLWYKDAVIYELHPKSFFDSSNDGIGDFRGITQKLDYLHDLGVTAIWLLPFYPSPLKDDGYDISDYTDVNRLYGTIGDFREFLRQAHSRGLRVITELVINHTSDQHRWFQKARRARPGSPARNFYVWSDTPARYREARVIFSDFEKSNWSWDHEAQAYYWHRFYSHQPDLNFENPRVQKALFDALDFWLEMGVDGLRLDAVPYLYEREGTDCENLPETHAFLKKLRAHIDRKFPNRMLLAEANQWPEDTIRYFGQGDETHMAFHFPVMPRLFMALEMEDRHPVTDILDPPPTIPDSCQWAMFLRNHDELTLEMVTDEERDYMYRFYARDPRSRINLGIRRRLAPLLGNDRDKIQLLNTLLFSLPGTPVIYYGDEIGMGDNYHLGDRDGVRTPMQWSPDRNAGFSRANPQHLYLPVIIDPEYHYEVVNVENQERNLSSLLWWTRRAIAMRRRFTAFGRGDIKFLNPANRKVLSFVREHNGEKVLVVANLSHFHQAVELDLSDYEGMTPEEPFSRNRFPRVLNGAYPLTLGPYDHLWLSLEPTRVEELAQHPEPVFEVDHLPEIFGETHRARFEQEALAFHLRGFRWFGGKGRTVCDLKVVEHAGFEAGGRKGFMLIFEVTFTEGLPSFCFFPIMHAEGREADEIRRQWPGALIAETQIDGRPGIIHDAAVDRAFRDLLLSMFLRRRRVRGQSGEFCACSGRGLTARARGLEQDSRVMGAEQSNTSIAYGGRLILKLYRRLEEGVHPDVEISRALAEAHFTQTPTYLGAIEYRRPDQPTIYAGLLQTYVDNSGDGWSYALDQVAGFFERTLSVRDRFTAPPSTPFMPSAPLPLDENNLMRELAGDVFSQMLRVLGERTAEMHLALARIDRPEFRPEPFTPHYQRSIYQGMKVQTRGLMRLLRDNLPRLRGDARLSALRVMEAETDIIDRYARLMSRRLRGMKIRIHGDYHLGQVLFSGTDFVIIDFEGEPARVMSERRLKRSPLRDLSGMARSFHYAAYTGLGRHLQLRPEDRELLEPWALAWSNYCANLFLHAYLGRARGAEFVPDDRADLAILFDAFLLEKAVYEVGYEVNNRPDWTPIPAQAIAHILARTDGGEK